MDITVFLEIIASVGFPIACVIALGVFVFKIYKRSEQREDKLMVEITETRKVNAEAISTISMYAERLGNMETNIEEIKTDVILIKEKMN